MSKAYDTRKPCSNCGTILVKSRYYDSLTNSYKLPGKHRDLKIWYRDSLVIQEAQTVNIETDINGVEKSEVVVDHYTFIDLRTRSFYIYNTFSADAPLVRKFTQPDTESVGGGWNFYDPTRIMWNADSTERLADTLINGVNVRRVKGVKHYNSLNGTPRTTYYRAELRCDKKNTLFHMDKTFDKTMGCPMVWFEYMILNKQSWTAFQVDYLSDTLTKEERQVFEAWEQNAKQNPVK